jgi:dGTPase
MAFPGINLTHATREGIARHATPFDDPVSFGEFAQTPNGGLECQIVDAADVLAYLSHDLDDAIAGRYMDLEEIAEVSSTLANLVEEAEAAWRTDGERKWPEEARPDLMRRRTVAKLIARSIDDLGGTTRARLADLKPCSPEAIRALADRSVVYSEPHDKTILGLLDLLTSRYYRSKAVKEADAEAERVMTALFKMLLERPSEVPERFRSKAAPLSVANYLISLNDRSAENLHKSLSQ